MMRMKRRLGLSGPAMAVAIVALLVALSGTAVAATAIVPLAKRALTADKAKVATLALNSQKLGGQTSAALVSQAVTQASAAAGPASTAAGLVTTKSLPFTVAPQGGEQVVTATCDSGSKAVGGGFNNPTAALVVSAGSSPTADGSGWTEDMFNLSSSTTGAGVVIATCLK